VDKFSNGRGTAEPWIKEGKDALPWTRLSCHRSEDNRLRFRLFARAGALGNLPRQMALSREVKHRGLTTLRERPIKLGARLGLAFQGGDVPGGRDGRSDRGVGEERRWGGVPDGDGPARGCETW
jgi:hypothetical protein